MYGQHDYYDPQFDLARQRADTLLREAEAARQARLARRARSAGVTQMGDGQGSRLRLSVLAWLRRVGGAAILGCLVFSGASAGGRAAPAGGSIRFFVTPGLSGATSTILFTGVIGDAGTVLSIDKNGESDTNGKYAKIILKKGAFEVNATGLWSILDKVQPTIDTATCSGYMSARGPVTLFNGTGLYKGIAGTLYVTATFAAILPRYTSGARKGECNTSDNAEPIVQYSAFTGAGTVRFG
jgi:hypothetical protein